MKDQSADFKLDLQEKHNVTAILLKIYSFSLCLCLLVYSHYNVSVAKHFFSARKVVVYGTAQISHFWRGLGFRILRTCCNCCNITITFPTC